MAVGRGVAANFKLAVVHCSFLLRNSDYKLGCASAMNLAFCRNLTINGRMSSLGLASELNLPELLVIGSKIEKKST
jgi:hypothetical protein